MLFDCSLKCGRFRAAAFLACLAGIVSILLLASPTRANGQSMFANLSGTVTDTTGAVVPGAMVNIQNVATKVVRQVVSNSAGYFSVTELPAGTYEVTADAKGFKKWQATGIALSSSDNRTLSIALDVGASTETVEVNATLSEVMVADTGEKSDIISAKQLNELSLVGRNATEYIKLMAGATLAANGAVNRPAYDGQVVGINGFAVGSNAGGLSNVAVNGQSIDITMDGQHSFDPGASGSATPVNPNPAMISEDAFAKESEISSGLKPGQLKVPSSYYYPGFNLSGPIIIPKTGLNRNRNKLFFMEGFEYYKQDLNGGIDRSFVPTEDMFNGDFSGLSSYSSIQRTLGVIPGASRGQQ